MVKTKKTKPKKKRIKIIIVDGFSVREINMFESKPFKPDNSDMSKNLKKRRLKKKWLGKKIF